MILAGPASIVLVCRLVYQYFVSFHCACSFRFFFVRNVLMFLSHLVRVFLCALQTTLRSVLSEKRDRRLALCVLCTSATSTSCACPEIHINVHSFWYVGVMLNGPPRFSSVKINKQMQTEPHSAGRSRRGMDRTPEAQPELHQDRRRGAVHVWFLVDDELITSKSDLSCHCRDTPVLGFR